MKNIERFKQDLEKLIVEGEKIHKTMQEVFSTQNPNNDKLDKLKIEYEVWFSESQEIVKQLLPERLDDFKNLYKRTNERKRIDFENYTISDALIGLYMRDNFGTILVKPSAALPRLLQQIGMVNACTKKFESSLFNIRHFVRADLFENELDASEELKKNGFLRAAGAIAGVVLESHLVQLCENYKIETKKNPGIHELNKLLLDNEVYEATNYEFIDYLRELRNKCDHKKKEEPTADEIDDLIKGVNKVIKTVY